LISKDKIVTKIRRDDLCPVVAEPAMSSSPAGAIRGDRDSQPMTTQFRPEIAGLRAIAVLGVVLFHLKVPGLSGGFAGADIFFVISAA
jgi:hypothetical protein